jgi:hypothetical protein
MSKLGYFGYTILIVILTACGNKIIPEINSIEVIYVNQTGAAIEINDCGIVVINEKGLT